jgi:WD40 repeat protein
VRIGLPARWPRSRNLGAGKSPSPAITELGAALADQAERRITSTEFYAKLTGKGQMWWRCCREAAQVQPYWLLGGDHDKALQQITDGELTDSQGAVSNAAIAADLVCRALAAPVSAATPAKAAAQAADCWNGSLAVITPGVASFVPETAVASAVSHLQDHLRRVIAGLDDVTTDTGQAMVAICALLLAAEKPDSGRVVAIPVVFARPGEPSSKGVTGVIELREFLPGPPGLFPDPRGMRNRRVNRDFANALKLAWQFATGSGGSSRCVLWRLWLDGGVRDDPIDGGSLGAAFAVGLRELLRVPRGSHLKFLATQRAYFTGLRPRRAITGVLAVERPVGYEYAPRSAKGPWLAEVGDMAAKLNAAKTSHLRLVAPAANETVGEQNVDWAYTVYEADRYARQVRLGRLVIAAVATLAIVGAAKLGFALSAAESQTTQQHNLAVSGTLAAQSQATGTSDPALARLEAVASWRLAPTSAAHYAMLKAATLPPFAILDGDGTALESQVFSADGKFLADSLNNGDVKVWDTATDQVTATLTGMANSAGLAFISDDSLVVTVNAEVEVWNLSSRQISSSFKTDGPVEYMAFSADGEFIATVPNNGAVQVWDVRTHHLSAAIKQSSPGEVDGMTFSPNGALLAISTQDGVQLWDVRTHRLNAAIPGEVDGMAFSPNGALLAISTQDGVQLWDLAANHLLATLEAGAGDPVAAVLFSLDGRELAVGTADDRVQVWNIASRQLMTTIHPGKVDPGPLAFSPDDSRLTTIDTSGSDVQVWNIASRQRINSFSSNGALAFSPDVSLAAEVTLTGTLQLMNVAAESELNYPAATLPSADPDNVWSIAFSPNGRLLAAGTQAVGNKSLGPEAPGHGIRLWDVATHDLVATLKASNDAPVDSVAFSPDNRLLAAGTFGDGTQVWNVTTHRLVTTFKSGNVDQVATVAFSGHGLLAAGTDGGGTQVWNVATGKLVTTLDHGPDDVSSVAFSPSGGLLAVGTTGGGPNMGMGHRGDGIQVWNTSTHELVTAFTVGNSNQVSMVAFSRTGSLLADTNAGIEVWNVSRQQLTTSFGSSASWVAFSQDGTVAAIPVANGIQLWDTATGQLAGTIPDDNTKAGSLPVAFTQDDTVLAAGANGGSVQLWKVPYVADAPGYLCSVAGISFPSADWTRYARGIAYQKTCP